MNMNTKTFQRSIMNGDNITTSLLIGNELDYVLFKLAIDSAERGLRVWFVSVKPFEEIPKEIQQPCKEVLQLIIFIYLSDYINLIKHLNSIHKWKHIPNVLILKNFDEYCKLYDPQHDSARTAFLAASLLDSVSFLSNKKEASTHLIVACSCLVGNEQILQARLKVLCDMFFDHVYFKSKHSNETLIKTIKQNYQKC